MKVVCVGHSTYDTTLPVNEYPEENNKYRIKHHIECGGGPAANGAYLLGKWGMETSIVSVVGDDYYGEKIREDFEHVGVNTDYLEVKENHDGEHPESAIEVLNNNPNALSVLDAGRLTDDNKVLGKLVKYLVCSHDFAEQFTGKKTDANDLNTMIEIHKEIVDYFQTNVIITLEAAGSFTIIDGEYQVIPSIEVKALDSTGAGDIFHGAFTYFMANGYGLLESIKKASITSAISVTRIGSRYSIPMLSEVIEYGQPIL